MKYLLIFSNVKFHQFRKDDLNYFKILKFLFAIGIFISPMNYSISQNLVNNGGFEEYTELPTSTFQWYKCVGWNHVNNLFTGYYGSPDYFHIEGSGTSKLPSTTFALVYPNSGKGIMGLGINDNSKPNYREYISSELKSPMIPGISYTISFYLTNGLNSWWSDVSCDNIGILFSTEPAYQDSFRVINTNPNIKIEGTVWNTKWKKYTFDFKADSAYQYLTFGCFGDTAIISYDESREDKKPSSYYYIDDIEIDYSIGAIEDQYICIGESVVLSAFNDNAFRWVANNNLDQILSYDSEVTVSPTDTTTYTVYGNNTSASVTVIPSKEYCDPILQMPNIFSPNGDSKNDLFTFIKEFAVESGTLIIINRWGQELYRGDIFSSGWDGSFESQPCADGVYFWSISGIGSNHSIINKSGHLTLIR